MNRIADAPEVVAQRGSGDAGAGSLEGAARTFAVLYAAKSTADVHGSLEQQRKDCLAFADREGLTVIGQFADEGYSGFSGNRGPDLERALALASEIAADRDVCHLICVHSDRLSRGAGDAPGAPRHLLEILFAANRAGVRLRSVQDDLNLSTPLYAAMIGTRNTEDSLRKSRSIKAQYDPTLRRLGRKPGGRPMYGRNPDYSIKPDEQAVLERMARESLAGRGEAAIARDLVRDGIPTATGGKLWRAGVVADMMKRPDLVGLVALSTGELIEGSFEPLLDHEAWAKLESRRASRKMTGRSAAGRTPVDPVIFQGAHRLMCGSCGSPMGVRRESYVRKDGSRRSTYVCTRRECLLTEGCGMARVPCHEVDETVIDFFLARHVDEEATLREHRESADTALREARRQVASAEREVMRAEERLARLKDRWRDGEIDTKLWESERAELEADHAGAVSACEQLSSRVATAEADGALVDAVSALERAIDEMRTAASADAVNAFRATMTTLFEGAILVDAAADEQFLAVDAIRLDRTATLKAVAIGRDALMVQLVPRADIGGALAEGYSIRDPGLATVSANVSLTCAAHLSDCRYARDFGRRSTSALRRASRNSSGPSKRRIRSAPVPTPWRTCASEPAPARSPYLRWKRSASAL